MANKKKGRIITGTVIVGTLLALYLLTRRAKATSQAQYSCSGAPNYTCSEDINGVYGTITECQAACIQQTQTIDIIVSEP